MTTDPDGKPCAHNEEQAEAAKRGLMFGSFDIVAFVEAVRKETAETHQGAVAMWGLETATSMFVGQKIMDEARRRLLPPNADVCAVSPGSAARCPKCNGVGYHVRVRNFDTEDADVWECQSPLCTAYGLLWHTPRPKDALGEMRCALLALVEAEKASRDNFDGNAIDRIERAMQRADRVLFPERYSPNASDEPRAKSGGANG